jgi:DNA-binding SARP family transcriptional activator
MPLLRLRLLGGFEIRGTDGQDLTPRSRRACGMLACLALPPGAAWPRDRLALTFWSERGEGQARGSVRQALADLRRSLGAGAIQNTERDAVMLKPDAAVVDAMEFEKAAKAGDLDRAAELYRGDLLESFTLRSNEFSDWLLVERTRLRDLAIEVFGRLTSSQSGEAAN